MPKAGPTGGALVTMGPREVLRGAPTELSAILWRSGRLERASRSSNDSELQSITGAGNLVYKVRIIWSELNGRNAGLSLRYDSLVRGRRSAAACPAILAVDSRGGYDAIYGQESAQLGLNSNRAAIEAYALKQTLEGQNFKIARLASDYNLADGFTKKK